MKKTLLMIIAVVLIATLAMAQNNLLQVSALKVFDGVAVTNTTDYVTSAVIPLGAGGGRNILGNFSYCFDLDGEEPTLSVYYQACNDEDGTLCTYPQGSDGTDLSVLVSDTQTWHSYGRLYDYNCFPPGGLLNDVGIFPYIRFIVKGIGSPAGSVNMWLIKH